MSVHFMLEQWKVGVAAVAGSGAAHSGTAGGCATGSALVPLPAHSFPKPNSFSASDRILAQRCSAVDLEGETLSAADPRAFLSLEIGV